MIFFNKLNLNKYKNNMYLLTIESVLTILNWDNLIIFQEHLYDYLYIYYLVHFFPLHYLYLNTPLNG